MKIKPFAVEEWMNAYETQAKYNIAETCVYSVSMNELFSLCGVDQQAFLSEFTARRLTYGDITGAASFKEGVCRLYKTLTPDELVTTHGAAGANHHVFYSLVEPGDRVISIMPTYQQLYSIPESFGADTHIMHLKEENGYLPDLDELRALAGLRLGWIATHDRDLLASLLSHRDYNHISCGMFDEALASVALSHSDTLLRHNRQIVRENLAILDDWVKSEPRIHYHKPQAGTTALVYYEYDLDSYSFCKRLLDETGAFVTPGDCFEEPKSMRIGYANDRQDLIDGLNAVSKLLQPLEAEGK